MLPPSRLNVLQTNVGIRVVNTLRQTDMVTGCSFLLLGIFTIIFTLIFNIMFNSVLQSPLPVVPQTFCLYRLERHLGFFFWLGLLNYDESALYVKLF